MFYACTTDWYQPQNSDVKHKTSNSRCEYTKCNDMFEIDWKWQDEAVANSKLTVAMVNCNATLLQIYLLSISKCLMHKQYAICAWNNEQYHIVKLIINFIFCFRKHKNRSVLISIRIIIGVVVTEWFMLIN